MRRVAGGKWHRASCAGVAMACRGVNRNGFSAAWIVGASAAKGTNTPANSAKPEPDDMRGGLRQPRRFIDSQTFFDFGDGNVRNNKKLDTNLSSVLMDLIGFPAGEPQSFAPRNLLRHLTSKLPSGQAVAKAMKLPVLHESELHDLAEHGLDKPTSLCFYILREPETSQSGERLGAVGARIVAEVFIGLMQGDLTSYLRQDVSCAVAAVGRGPPASSP